MISRHIRLLKPIGVHVTYRIFMPKSIRKYTFAVACPVITVISSVITSYSNFKIFNLLLHYLSRNATVTVVPTPSFEVRDKSALYSVQMCFTIARPSPVPPVSRERDLLTR